MKKKILLTFQAIREILPRYEFEFEIVRESEVPSTERVIELALETQPDGLLVTNAQVYDAATIAKLPPSVKVIATCSVGFEHVDLKACVERGILVTNTPDVLTEACADLAMFLLLGAARRGKESLKLIEKGWGEKLNAGDLLGFDLRGKKLGILGMGRIGQAFAARARAFGIKIYYCNRHRLPPSLELEAKYFAQFNEMLPHCDFVSLHAPGNPQTKGRMGSKEFSQLRDRAVFINISRGSLVDEDALIEALQSGKLFAAGLDVCLHEPNPDPRLLRLKNVFMTPHIASATEETRQAMIHCAFENLQAATRGERPRDLVQL